MVLESIISPLTAERSPWRLFFIGALYSTIAVFLALWVFNQYASLVMVFLTVLACTPLMYNTIRMEEEKDLKIEKETTLLKEHAKALTFFMALFGGVTVAFAILYVALPSEISSLVFSVQQETIAHINGRATSLASAEFHTFSSILLNNVKVMVFCVLFAFIYGLGAIFILVWNASVIATAMGEFFRVKLAAISASLGYMGAAGYFTAGIHSIIRYAPHGVLEILSYFVAGLAGGIISVAVINHDFGTHKFEKIIFDSANLLMIAFFILFIAALVETFITPLFF